jgi:Family of unknown function (DUF5681)
MPGITEFQPGQSGNPNGRPAGSRNKRTSEIISEIRKLGHKDCLLRLSEIVHSHTDTALVIQASNVPAPYIHSKRGTIPAPRFVEEAIAVPDFACVDEALDFQKEVARRAAAGELELQTSLDISVLVGNWIRSRQASVELDLKVRAQSVNSANQRIIVEGGLPPLPGSDVIMPRLNGVQGQAELNGHTIDHAFQMKHTMIPLSFFRPRRLG